MISFRLHGMNGRQIHRLLARMIDLRGDPIPAKRHATPSMLNAVARATRLSMSGPIIPSATWTSFPIRANSRSTATELAVCLLLPKSFNASYGDLPYAEKREQYVGQNLLARSLHEGAYDHNPGFKRFIVSSGLAFQAHGKFKKADLDARQELYGKLAEQIWSTDQLKQEAES